MKKQFALPLAAVAGGIAAFVLRLLQSLTGFEADTGLPIPGNPAGLALVVLLAALAILLLVLVRQLPKEAAPGPAFPADFSTKDARLLTLPVLGVFLIALSGAVDLLMGLGLLDSVLSAAVQAADPSGMTAVTVVTTGFSSKAHLLMGVLSLLSAAGLFLCIAACRRRDAGEESRGTWLLVPVVALVVRLVLTYRIDSVDPSLEAYYVELLALVFLTLGFYRLSSFAFRAGRTGPFALYGCAAVVLCAATLGDGGSGLSSTLLYAGGAAVLLGFLLLRLASRPVPEPEEED